MFKSFDHFFNALKSQYTLKYGRSGYIEMLPQLFAGVTLADINAGKAEYKFSNSLLGCSNGCGQNWEAARKRGGRFVKQLDELGLITKRHNDHGKRGPNKGLDLSKLVLLARTFFKRAKDNYDTNREFYEAKGRDVGQLCPTSSLLINLHITEAQSILGENDRSKGFQGSQQFRNRICIGKNYGQFQYAEAVSEKTLTAIISLAYKVAINNPDAPAPQDYNAALDLAGHLVASWPANASKLTADDRPQTDGIVEAARPKQREAAIARSYLACYLIAWTKHLACLPGLTVTAPNRYALTVWGSNVEGRSNILGSFRHLLHTHAHFQSQA